MQSKQYHVTDTELLVLQVLWDRGQATTREVCDAIYPEGSTSQYYTVQKLLERLEKRNCVIRDRRQRVHVFSAAIDRETLIQERLRGLSDTLCGGAVIPMLTGLIQMRRWTASEQKQLKELLKEVPPKKLPKD
ncbi:BlaI/MecI/CopY family transcriptional regulator [Gimesia sp.]|uniref:BlaI/MecI/CopY family transcriptional regulator n=1 Tax=Gimesia sp. TaxID=2024833 RepID=UPI000C605980|nr:BlaI/MecI/CopY family transcriptional regulator [Gimesia sp.]MAX39832.1 transcriptional regulator [Gimesia sp.]HAH49308.1 transcriptional regulator [Planctomycetaceae bacterium]|tara:strand:- start:5711 stop:6109 length:399 start_codon:yes stop_codon:yes gene_type:complete